MDYGRIHIIVFQCLYAPRHTAFKTKKNIFMVSNNGREFRSKKEKPPPAEKCSFCGLLRLLYQAAEFVEKYKFGCFFLPNQSNKTFVQCRSPPSVKVADYISNFTEGKICGNGIIEI